MKTCDACGKQITGYSIELLEWFRKRGVFDVCSACNERAAKVVTDVIMGFSALRFMLYLKLFTGRACESCGGSGLVTVMLKPGGLFRRAVTEQAPCGYCLMDVAMDEHETPEST
jgi:hypothetical protein